VASSPRSRPDLLVRHLLEETGIGPITASEQAAAAEASFIPLARALRIPIERIAPNPDNPRKTFEGLADLAASIADRGLLQPLVVRREAERPGYYVTIAGARRLMAALLVYQGDLPESRQWVATLPCVVADEVDSDAFADALAENMARQDLSRAEVMEAVLRLHRQYGWSSRAIARRTGRNDSDISILLRVAQDEQVAALVREEVIAPTTAGTIQRLPEEARSAVLAGVHAGNVRTGADVRRVVRRFTPAGGHSPRVPGGEAPRENVPVVRDITHPAAKHSPTGPAGSNAPAAIMPKLPEGDSPSVVLATLLADTPPAALVHVEQWLAQGDQWGWSCAMLLAALRRVRENPEPEEAAPTV